MYFRISWLSGQKVLLTVYVVEPGMRDINFELKSYDDNLSQLLEAVQVNSFNVRCSLVLEGHISISEILLLCMYMYRTVRR